MCSTLTHFFLNMPMLRDLDFGTPWTTSKPRILGMSGSSSTNIFNFDGLRSWSSDHETLLINPNITTNNIMRRLIIFKAKLLLILPLLIILVTILLHREKERESSFLFGLCACVHIYMCVCVCVCVFEDGRRVSMNSCGYFSKRTKKNEKEFWWVFVWLRDIRICSGNIGDEWKAMKAWLAFMTSPDFYFFFFFSPNGGLRCLRKRKSIVKDTISFKIPNPDQHAIVYMMSFTFPIYLFIFF